MREDEGMTLVEFLLARIAEDEAAGKDPYVWQFSIARWEAECEAKRKIVGFHGSKMLESCQEDGQLFPCRSLRTVVAIYADHADYREEWR